MIQSLRFSEWAEAEELIAAIRNNLPTDDVAAILQRNVGSLRHRGALWPVAIGDLQVAFSGPQASSVDGEFSVTGPSTHDDESSLTGLSKHDDESSVFGPSEQDETVAGNEEGEPSVREEAIRGHWRIGADLQRHQALPDQLKTYERWIHLFGTWPNVAADRQLERAWGRGRATGAPAGDWDQGLWRKMSALGLSPDGGPQLSRHSSEEEPVNIRTNWHPALQIHLIEEEESQRPRIELVPAEVTKLQEVTDLIAAQESGETGGWVEIVKSIPDFPDGTDGTDGMDGSGEDGNLEPTYRFESARYPLHAVQTVTAFEDSPLSRVITDYREAARAAIHHGMAPIDIMGHDGVEVELFFRDRTFEDNYSVGNWASEVSRSF